MNTAEVAIFSENNSVKSYPLYQVIIIIIIGVQDTGDLTDKGYKKKLTKIELKLFKADFIDGQWYK